MSERNPQAKQMADESMVRNLTAQADAIWPQEEPIIRGHGSPRDILDVGCGTGEISSRLATLFPTAQVTGVDLIEPHLALARSRYAAFGDRLRFQQADAFELPFEARSFDLVVCRHMLQAVPTPERVIAEMVRVTRPGGRVHLLVEDYDMIHASGTGDVSSFWHVAPRVFGGATGTDLHIGRNAIGHLRRLAVDDIHTHYAIVDTERVPRATFATIFEAWRDGYANDIAGYLGWSPADVRAQFDATIECVRTGYAVWFVPIVTARVR
ncbi:MAG TPA: class I SAM-dependent methyltransferase [Kofleriaceae bacterium]|nr:class I SAM-dependent methyltransferase [Kofleriaceae bacterium]